MGPFPLPRRRPARWQYVAQAVLTPLLAAVWHLFLAPTAQDKALAFLYAAAFAAIEFGWYSTTVQLPDGNVRFAPFSKACRPGFTTWAQFWANVVYTCVLAPPRLARAAADPVPRHTGPSWSPSTANSCRGRRCASYSSRSTSGSSRPSAASSSSASGTRGPGTTRAATPTWTAPSSSATPRTGGSSALQPVRRSPTACGEPKPDA